MHVRSRDRRRRLGVDDRALGASQFDRGEDAVVERQVAGNAMGQHDQRTRLAMMYGLELKKWLVCGEAPVEVEDQVVAGDGQRARDLEELLVALGPRGRPVGAVRASRCAGASRPR